MLFAVCTLEPVLAMCAQASSAATINYSCHCREIESLKERYESKLQVEKNLAVTLKGENGLMRKRFNGLEKAIEEQKSEIRRLHEAQDTLYSTIATHEKDMQALKEVWDSHIGRRDKPCYDAICILQAASPQNFIDVCTLSAGDQRARQHHIRKGKTHL
jgi:hypothetical protein